MSVDYFFLMDTDAAASSHPVLVMLDEQTGERYARVVAQKGLGDPEHADWLIKDLAEELRAWGHTGGEGGH